MSDVNDKKWEPGDLALYWSGSGYGCSEQWCEVTRVTSKGTVFTVNKHDQETEHRGGRGLRRPSAGELAVRAWLRAKPKTKFAVATTAFLVTSNVPRQVALRDDEKLDTSEKILQCGEEMILLAEWWAQKP